MSYVFEARVHDATKIPTDSNKPVWFVTILLKIPAGASRSIHDSELIIGGHVRYIYSKKDIEHCSGWMTYSKDQVWNYEHFTEVHADTHIRNMIDASIRDFLVDRHERQFSNKPNRTT